MQNQHLYILTGASRGMGLAIAQQLVQPSHVLVGISRRSNDALAAQAAAAGVKLEQWEQDLAQGEAASARLAAWLGQQDAKAFTSVTLVNNAGVIPRIAPLADSDAADLANALRVGLEAPMLMTAAFLNATKGWSGARRVLNISSGLGRRAMASQSAYCAAKAGMDHFTRCLALDEAALPNGAKVCSLAPGVIDTDMQVQLRGADASAFPDRTNFVNMKEQGSLTSAGEAAARILKFLARPDFGQNPVADVRDA